MEGAGSASSLGEVNSLNGGGLSSAGHGDTSVVVGGHNLLKLLSGGVVDKTLAWLVLLSGEKDELAAVGLETGGVQHELLVAGGGAAVVNGDANGAGEGLGDLGLLELGEGEAAAVAVLASVLAGGLGDNGAQAVGGAGEHLSGLLNSILVSLDLLGRLVEVGLGADSSFPVLAQVHVGYDVVVLDHC